jgi:5-methylcytosine-specific restriction endonuclease McrA
VQSLSLLLEAVSGRRPDHSRNLTIASSNGIFLAYERRFLHQCRQQGGKADFSTRVHPHGSNGKMNAKVLILNQNYEPMSVINVKKAIVLLYLGKAELIIAQDGKRVHSVSMSMPFPSIVRLSVFVRVPFKKIILSRKNILRRDAHRCQYCGRADIPLTVDHVMPISRGGEDTWENLACACVRCNNKKGDRTPEEALMSLRRKPMRPNHVTFIRHFVGTLDERWKPYLFLN